MMITQKQAHELSDLTIEAMHQTIKSKCDILNLLLKMDNIIRRPERPSRERKNYLQEFQQDGKSDVEVRFETVISELNREIESLQEQASDLSEALERIRSKQDGGELT